MFDRVASESEKYKLTIGRYTSDSQAGDALKWHNGMRFSTPDRDNDVLLGKKDYVYDRFLEKINSTNYIFV